MKKLLLFLLTLFVMDIIYAQNIKKLDDLFKSLPDCIVKISPEMVSDKLIPSEYSKIITFGSSHKKHYALFKYNISKNYLGYIVKYSDSKITEEQICLLVYDLKSQKFQSLFVLASISGLEGREYNSYSLIIDLDNDDILDILTMTIIEDYISENSLDTKIRLWKKNKYVDVTNKKI